GETDGVHRRQVVADAAPALAAILRNVHVAGGAAEAHPVAARVERVPVHHVVGVLLRQPLAERLPARPAVARAGDEQAAVDAHALVVRLGRHYPRGERIAIVGGDREAEVHRHLRAAHPLPAARAVVAGEHAAVVLLPEAIGRAGAAG